MVKRGVRQGCSLVICSLLMLYSFAIEPLQNKLRRELTGVCFLRCASAFKLSSYAYDVEYILDKQSDIHILEENVGLLKKKYHLQPQEGSCGRKWG